MIYYRREGEVIRQGLNLQWWRGPAVYIRVWKWMVAGGWHLYAKTPECWPDDADASVARSQQHMGFWGWAAKL